MEPMTVVAVITAALPFLTAGIKKVFKTDRIPDEARRGVHALLPILLGVISSGVYAYSHGSDWVTALAIGLGSGGAASSARDIDKNLTKLVETALAMVAKRKA